MYDVPLLVLVGEITEKPVVVDHQVVVRPVIPITATIDHRYVDGWHVSRLMRAFQGYLAAPSQFEPALASLAPPPPVEQAVAQAAADQRETSSSSSTPSSSAIFTGLVR